MVKRIRTTAWSRLMASGMRALTAGALRQLKAAAKPRRAKKAATAKPGHQAVKRPPAVAPGRGSPGSVAGGRSAGARAVASGLAAGGGDWSTASAAGPGGSRHYWLYRPPLLLPGERLPLLVMLHGCTQDAQGFAASTRMNRLAATHRFAVLYPQQDRLANHHGCWNWFDTRSGRAQTEAGLILAAVDQVCARGQADRQRVVVAGLSAGAAMAALLAALHPGRFKAVVMHSGVPPGSASTTLTALAAMHGRRQLQGAAARGALAAGAAAAAAAGQWPPLLVIHGEADTVVAASNARDAVALWAGATSAKAGPARTVQRGQRHAMTVTDYRLRGHTAARLVTVAGLGHAWSGGAGKLPFGDPAGQLRRAAVRALSRDARRHGAPPLPPRGRGAVIGHGR